MKAASLSEIKKELKSIPQEVLIEVALRVAKYKKETRSSSPIYFLSRTMSRPTLTVLKRK